VLLLPRRLHLMADFFAIFSAYEQPRGLSDRGAEIFTAPSGRRNGSGAHCGHRPLWFQPRKGRKDKLMRVTTGSQDRFSACGYLRSKQ
jgi:hypothetical protein